MSGHSKLVQDPQTTLKQVRNQFKIYGRNATAFITMYDGFKYFVGRYGTIAYVSTPTAWVGGGEPLGATENHLLAVEEFFAAAQLEGKSALLLPISKDLALKARNHNRWAVQIGSEPWMPLEHGNTRSDYFKFLPIAKQLKSQGATVTEFRLDECTSNELTELKSLAERWIESRKSAALGFLNRFEPFSLSQDKCYFKLHSDGVLQGFIAAVQVPMRNAWYLVDLVRAPDATPGTTELLVVETMEILRGRGVREVTLGMSPLVPIFGEEALVHPSLYRWLSFIFKHGGQFYGFRSLYNYKDKFQPRTWEPNYLLVSDEKFRLSHGLGLFNAIYPDGIFSTLKSTALQMFRRFKPNTTLAPLLSPRIVSRSLPTDWSSALLQLRSVAALLLIHLTFFFANPAIDTIGFSWNRMLDDGFSLRLLSRVISSSLYHGHSDHLIVNMILLVVFGSLLELTVGSAITIGAFFLGTLFSNLLTALSLGPMLSLISPAHMSNFAQEIDIGCSLGVFAILGAFLTVSRWPKALAATATIGVIAFCWVEHSFIELNHLYAILIGFLFAKTTLKL